MKGGIVETIVAAIVAGLIVLFKWITIYGML